ncbi:MAG: metallophosphoesterase family protein [Pirellulales bacterium]|nr:metallophosphoesterase family protein [Pirellulales bacterium]
MKLLTITDLHGRQPVLERILARAGGCDALLFGGDITNFGSPIDAERLIKLAQAAVPAVFAVAGNCDSGEIDRRLVEMGVSLAGRGVMLGEIGIQGLSGMPPWKRGMYQFTEEELAAALEAGHAAIAAARHRIVLSHPPPRGARVDRTFLLKHVGSTSLRAFIERTQPPLVLCGHIHEGRGVEQIGKTTVVNCGEAAGGYYAVADVGDQIHAEIFRA